MSNSAISKEHIEFVSKKSGIDKETVIKVLEADTEYLEVVIEEVANSVE